MTQAPDNNTTQEASDAEKKLNDFTKTTVKGTAWTYTAYYGSKVLIFVSTVILARLLTREEYGLVGFALVTISFLNVMTDFGVGPALIYHDEDDERTDTGFWLSVLTGIGLFIFTWMIAPLVGEFFNDPRAVPITRVLGLTFPLRTLGTVHESLIRKRLLFRLKFIPDIAKSISKGTFSIALALAGLGAWSLVYGQLIGALVFAIVLWVVVPYRPRFRIKAKYVRPLLGYGAGIVVLDIVSIFLTNGDYAIIGRFLGAEALGIYTVAFRIPDMLIIEFCTVIGSVLFPMYAKMRDDHDGIREAFLRTMRYMTILTLPVGIGIALVAEPLVITFFSEKWLDAIRPMQAIALYAVFRSISYNIGSVYKAQGKLGILTGLQVFRAVMLLPALLYAASVIGTIEAVAWAHALTAGVGGIFNLIVAASVTRTRFIRILENLLPATIGVLIMSIAVLAMFQLVAAYPYWVQLIATVSTGVVAYTLAMWQIENEMARQVMAFALRKVQNYRKRKS